jgi:hypothetical protein
MARTRAAVRMCINVEAKQSQERAGTMMCCMAKRPSYWRLTGVIGVTAVGLLLLPPPPTAAVVDVVVEEVAGFMAGFDGRLEGFEGLSTCSCRACVGVVSGHSGSACRAAAHMPTLMHFATVCMWPTVKGI